MTSLNERERDELRARLVNARWNAAQPHVASLDACAQSVVRSEVKAEVAWYVDAFSEYFAARTEQPRPEPRPTPECTDPECPIYARHRRQGRTYPPHGQHDFRARSDGADALGVQP